MAWDIFIYLNFFIDSDVKESFATAVGTYCVTDD